MKNKYIFGPIHSRRLGRSLGVDLVTAKCCSENCIYCEAGETTELTCRRREYVPVDEVIAELRAFLSAAPAIDWITFSGSGEPTLNSRFGDVAAFIKREFPQYRLCLLTNGWGLGDPALQQEIRWCDLVVPSLDASDAAEFQTINRPVAELQFDDFIRGLESFCRTTTATVWIELFLVPGINDSEESLARFAAILRRLPAAKLQLNALDRPGVADWLRVPEEAVMRHFADVLGAIMPVEIVGPCRQAAGVRTVLDCRICGIAAERPVTPAELRAALQEEDERVLQQRVAALVRQGVLQREAGETERYFCAAVNREISEHE
ncbi:MAG: radical SAM protein [Lentisphaeria bacterium]|nr:radical SAM protein [Lentisphaeria bacterium]